MVEMALVDSAVLVRGRAETGLPVVAGATTAGREMERGREGVMAGCGCGWPPLFVEEAFAAKDIDDVDEDEDDEEGPYF